ncbi:hypothetical protein AV530_003546 [Patagioenas fasciata monilis]|uniref:Uncharacterized protein n=1 Tax=Patagioenas fasciata monilis TaxID=372326 RepID=A0A1V4K2S8_PATFA|nr:hypothetical protein AV530_003546 [Patagioenas fasciata monilis]
MRALPSSCGAGSVCGLAVEFADFLPDSVQQPQEPRSYQTQNIKEAPPPPALLTSIEFATTEWHGGRLPAAAACGGTGAPAPLPGGCEGVCEDGRRGPASRSLNGDSRTAL